VCGTSSLSPYDAGAEFALGRNTFRNRRFYRQLRHDAYDLILDTQGLLKTGLISGMARKTPSGKKSVWRMAPRVLGYEGVSRIFHDLSVPVDKHTHAVLRGCLVAAAAWLATLLTHRLVSACVRSAGDTSWKPATPYVVFFHGTAGAAKKWVRDNWIAIAAYLRQYDLPILLPWGSPAEKAEAMAMAAAMPNATVLPALSMQEATILAQSAALAIGVDTGLTHIAAAYETPTIEIYCASPKWKTEGNWSPKIINLGDNGVPPGVAEVEQAIQQLL
jgi:heptosyltransferase-1